MTSGGFVQSHSPGLDRPLCEPLAGRSPEIALASIFQQVR